MRHPEIKRRVIREALTLVAIIAGLGGLAYGLTLLRDETETTKNTLQSEVSTLTNERQSLQGKFTRVTQNLDLYDKVMQQLASGQFYIGRDQLRRKIEEFRTRYFLNDMSITMSATAPAQNGKYQYKVGQLVTSELVANFDALADEHIFSLMYNLQEELSGGLKVTKFNVSRTSKLTNESLRTIAREGRYSLVKGVIHFTWYGMETPPEPAAPAAKPPVPTP